MNETPLINGVRHSWASISINMLGRTVTGVAKIDYDDNQNYENIYGAGTMPVHRGKGNYEAKASIELYQYEVVGIQEAAGGRITDIDPFDIVVVYKPTGSDALVTDIIRNVQIKTNVRSVDQGATHIKVPLELIVSDIVWHGQE